MKCNQNPAVIKITKIKDGTYLELALCQECAANESAIQKKIQEKTNLTSLLSNLMKNKVEGEAAAKITGEPESHKLECSNCGCTMTDYKNSFLLGCPQCYEEFEPYLTRVLRKVHGSTSHEGKTPKRFVPGVSAKMRGAIDEISEETDERDISDLDTNSDIDDEVKETPAETATPEQQLLALRRQLDQATENEDFKLAAQLRDEIKELETELTD